MHTKIIQYCLTALAAALLLAGTRTTAAGIAGHIQIAGGPIAGSTVTLYAAGTGTPTQLAQGRTDSDGAFQLDISQPPAESVFYLVTKGGTSKVAEAGANDAIVLMSLLGTSMPQTVTVNELTTVASTFTAARFINGETISGNPLGLKRRD